jgi:acyl-CoA thioesterase FadM
LTVSIRATEFTRAGFDLLYKIEKKSAGASVITAVAKTAMTCYDYDKKRIVSLPESVRIKLNT